MTRTALDAVLDACGVTRSTDLPAVTYTPRSVGDWVTAIYVSSKTGQPVGYEVDRRVLKRMRRVMHRFHRRMLRKHAAGKRTPHWRKARVTIRVVRRRNRTGVPVGTEHATGQTPLSGPRTNAD